MVEGEHPALRIIAPYTPSENAILIENVGVGKVRLAILPTLMLEILAGALIAFGAIFPHCDHNGLGRRFRRGPVARRAGFLARIGPCHRRRGGVIYWQLPDFVIMGG